MASMPRRARSRSTPAPVDPPPMTTTPVLVSGIQKKEERTAPALSSHPSGPSTTLRPRRPLLWRVPSRPSRASAARLSSTRAAPPSVHLEGGQLDPRVRFHRVRNFLGLIADRLEGRPHNVGPGDIAGQPDDGATRVHV